MNPNDGVTPRKNIASRLTWSPVSFVESVCVAEVGVSAFCEYQVTPARGQNADFGPSGIA